jgi:copper ion binding protein
MTSPRLAFDVPGMTCDHCVHAVSEELSKIEGVTAVDVDLDTKRVVVEGSDDVEAIRAAVDEAGYEAAI